MSILSVVSYVRCSSAEQAAEGHSLFAQRNRIEAWCAASEATLVEHIEDAGVSGTRPLESRPGGSRLHALLRASSPPVDAVVIVRLDRLGRDAAETLAVLRRFSRGQVGLISIVDRIDLTTPQGRAMAQLGAVFAELERSLIAQRTSEALVALRRERLVYGPVPYGLAQEGAALRECEGEMRVIRTMKRLRTHGESYRAIAESLNGRGVRAKRGGTWHAMSVRSVLRTHDQIAKDAA